MQVTLILNIHSDLLLHLPSLNVINLLWKQVFILDFLFCLYSKASLKEKSFLMTKYGRVNLLLVCAQRPVPVPSWASLCYRCQDIYSFVTTRCMMHFSNESLALSCALAVGFWPQYLKHQNSLDGEEIISTRKTINAFGIEQQVCLTLCLFASAHFYN